MKTPKLLVMLSLITALSVSSLAEAAKVTFYKDDHLKGDSRSFTADESNLDSISWGDAINSARLEGNTCVTIYQHESYRGRKITLYPKYGRTQTDYVVLPDFSDSIHSFQVEECTAETLKSLVWVYFNYDYKEDEGMQAFSANAPLAVSSDPKNPVPFDDGGIEKLGEGRLYPYTMANDRISSIQVPEDVAAIYYGAYDGTDSEAVYEIPKISPAPNAEGWPADTLDANNGYSLSFDHTNPLNDKMSSIMVKWMNYEMVKMDLQKGRITKAGDTFTMTSRLDNFGGSGALTMEHGLSAESSQTWSNSWTESVSKSVTVGLSVEVSGSPLGVGTAVTASVEAGLEVGEEWSEGTEISETTAISTNASIEVAPYTCTLALVDTTINEYEIPYLASLVNKLTGKSKIKKGVLAGAVGTSSNVKTEPCPPHVSVDYIPGGMDTLYTLDLPEIEIIDYTGKYPNSRIKLQLRGYHRQGMSGPLIFMPNMETFGESKEAESVANLVSYPPVFLLIYPDRYELWVLYAETDGRMPFLINAQGGPRRVVFTSQTAHFPAFMISQYGPIQPSEFSEELIKKIRQRGLLDEISGQTTPP